MTRRSRRALISIVALSIALLLVLVWWLLPQLLSPVETEPYAESFDEVGSWTAGEGASSEGRVADGVYEMIVDVSGDSFWTTAGRKFADGIYQVEATPLEGTEDNGYGLLFRVDAASERFYMLKVSSDGYVFAGLCSDSCAGQQALVDRDWFGSQAVVPGLGATNTLRVVAAESDLTFFVNDVEVGHAVDETLEAGDIGLIAETFTPGGLRVAFDNFTVMPLGGE
ncbi:MAG: hypothetical protein JSW55_03915 [Chloroflexota bacterium]|nr:MAG: hypothetical protein JSW55_03915 [Chloroflexota bacterium]